MAYDQTLVVQRDYSLTGPNSRRAVKYLFLADSCFLIHGENIFVRSFRRNRV